MAKQSSNAPPADNADAAVPNDVDLAETTPEEILGQDESPDTAYDALAEELESDETETVEDEDEAEDSESEEESADDTDSEHQEDETDEEEGDEDGEEAADEDDESAKATPTKKFTPEEVEELYETNRQLLRLKGKQGKNLGDARSEIARRDGVIAHLNKRLAKAEGREPDEDETSTDAEEIPQTKEEWDALFATEPLKATELYNQVRDQHRAQAVEEAKKQAEMEKTLVTPEVGVALFRRTNQIKNFDKWSQSAEGVAVNQTIAADKRTRLAMLAAINTGDAEEVSNILSEALEAVRGVVVVKKAGKVSKVQAEETRSSRPKSVARPGRTVHPKASSKITEMSSEDILNLSNRDFARLMSGR
jgi:hypothetical protein